MDIAANLDNITVNESNDNKQFVHKNSSNDDSFDTPPTKTRSNSNTGSMAPKSSTHGGTTDKYAASLKSLKFESSTIKYHGIKIIVPNGEYGWVVVLASFFVQIFIVGSMNSFGVFFPVYIDAFGESASSVAWVGSIMNSMAVLLAGVAGSWSDSYGNKYVMIFGGVISLIGYILSSYTTALWQLYLTQGVIMGVGFCFAFISGVSVVGQWFTTHRGLAVGICVAGGGIGQLTMSLVSGYLISHYGWRAALRYLGIIIMGGLIPCWFGLQRLIPLNTPNNKFTNQTSNTTDSALTYFKDRNFVVIYISALFTVLGMLMPYTCITQYAELKGISASGAIFLLSIMGIGGAAGRVSIGVLADNWGKLLMYRICIAGSGITTLFWVLCTSYTTIGVYVVLFGFFSGGFFTMIPSVSAELFGIRKLGSCIGVLYTSNFFGSLFSAPLGGFLFDQFNSYTISILTAGSIMMFACIVTVFVDPSKIVGEKNEQENGMSLQYTGKTVSTSRVHGIILHENTRQGEDFSHLDDNHVELKTNSKTDESEYKKINDELNSSFHVVEPLVMDDITSSFHVTESRLANDDIEANGSNSNALNSNNREISTSIYADPYAFKFGAFEDGGTFKYGIVLR
eukprot:gene10490-14097_t